MEQEEVQANDPSVEAAFAASFNDQPIESVAVSEVKEEPKAEVKEEPKAEVVQEAAPTAPTHVVLTPAEIAELRATASKVHEFEDALRKTQGRMGALNDQLKQTMKAKEADGKPATLTAMELKKTREEFPELAESIRADLQEYFANQQGGNPEDTEARIEARLAKQREELAKEAIAERQEILMEDHPDAKEIINSQVFLSWVNELPAREREVLQNTNSPYILSKKLTAFKSWHDAESAKANQEAQAKAKKQERLDAAITPKGAGRSSQPTLSEREEMEKGLELGFNS